jgi:hypothetical protein
MAKLPDAQNLGFCGETRAGGTPAIATNSMNIHVSAAVRQQWPSLEFLGKSWERDKFTWIRANHKALGITLRFCFELQCAVDGDMYDFICKNGYFG